jgi:YcxB-like protein
MEIRFTPIPEDADHFLRANPGSSWDQFLYILLLAVLFFIGTYLVQNHYPVAGIVWLALSALIAIGMYEIPRRRARRAMTQNTSAQGEIVLTVEARGIAAVFPTGSSQVEWRAYTNYKETSHLFLLRSGPGRWTYVPKRVLSPEKVQQLREILRNHLRKQQPPT